MSHSTVLVLGEDVESQLEPFYEGLEVPEYRRYLDTENKWWLKPLQEEDPGLDENDLPRIARLLTERWGEPHEVDERGVYSMSTCNPDSRWDWFVVGGRWSGLLLATPEAVAEGRAWKGERGVSGSHHDASDLAVDSCLRGDLDEQGMRARRLAELAEVQAEVTAPGYRPSPWDDPEHVAWLRAASDADLVDRVTSEPPVRTFAVLAEGVWREPGRMGWFGTDSSDERSRANYDQWWARFYPMIPAEVRLTVVDVHI